MRFAAAALSDSAAAPLALVRQIAALPVDVSAPLLVRSPLLGEVDLIALIGRLGLAHARAIARRPQPGPRLKALLSSLRDEDIARRFPPLAGEDRLAVARERLRAIGRDQTPAGAAHWRSLCDSALTGIPALFQTALADALETGFSAAGRIVEREVLSIAAFRVIGLSAEQAFLLVCATGAARLAAATFIRQFFSDYDSLDIEACSRVIDEVAVEIADRPAVPAAQNGDRAAPAGMLKAS